MKCPYCKQDDDRVVDSRSSEDGLAIRRRRECLRCSRRYTSYERIDENPVKVIKASGTKASAVHVAERPGDIRHSCASVDRIQNGLGWSAQTGLENGLQITYAWYRSQS